MFQDSLRATRKSEVSQIKRCFNLESVAIEYATPIAVVTSSKNVSPCFRISSKQGGAQSDAWDLMNKGYNRSIQIYLQCVIGG